MNEKKAVGFAIDLEKTKMELEERKEMRDGIREAEDKADAILSAMFETLSSEDSVEALGTFLTGTFLEGGSTADAFGKFFGGPEGVAVNTSLQETLEGIHRLLSELASREDPAKMIIETSKQQIVLINAMSRRLYDVEGKVNTLLGLRGVVTRAPRAASPDLLELPLDEPAPVPPAERKAPEPEELQFLTDGAAEVSTYRDYKPPRPEPQEGAPRRRKARPPAQHPDLKGTAWANRHTAAVRKVGEQACLEAGRLLSKDSIRKAVARAGIDVSKYESGFISNALRNGFLRFGDDAWWPSGPPIPDIGIHTTVRIPVLTGFHPFALPAVHAMNAKRREEGKDECELIFAVRQKKMKVDPSDPVDVVEAPAVEDESKPDAVPASKIPKRPTRGVKRED